MLQCPQYVTIEVLSHQLHPYQPLVEVDDDNTKPRRGVCALKLKTLPLMWLTVPVSQLDTASVLVAAQPQR